MLFSPVSAGHHVNWPLAAAVLAMLLLMLAAPPAPARADQAWIDVPDSLGSFKLPDAALVLNAGSPAIAMNDNYVIIVWPYDAVAGLGYKAMVGEITSTNDGETLSFNSDRIHTIVSGSGSDYPSVAINKDGYVLFAVNYDGDTPATQACKVAGSGNSLHLHCGEIDNFVGEGTDPSVALNDDGMAVLTYEGELLEELFCRVGTLNTDKLTMDWGNSSDYDSGSTSRVFLRGSNVFQVHHGATNIFHPHKLYYRLGILDEEKKEIYWRESHEYETDGQYPLIAANAGGEVVVAMHQSAKHERTFYRYGTRNSTMTELSWQDGDGGHRWGTGHDGDDTPCLAVSPSGKVVFVCSNFDLSEDPYKYYYTVGSVGMGPVGKLPSVGTQDPTSVTSTSAVVGGTVHNPGTTAIIERGVAYDLSPNPTINEEVVKAGTGTGSFTASLDYLYPNTRYYIRAYATNANGTAYGENLTFHTGEGLPTALTYSPWFVTYHEALASGAVLDQGGGEVTDRGLCWSTSADPTISGDHLSAGSGLGGFTEYIQSLSPSTAYHLRAYATNVYGTAYGADITFSTPGDSLPTVYTTDPTDITASSAVLGGLAESQGSSAVSERGVVWSTDPLPNLSNQKQAMGSGLGSFAQEVTGLSYESTYYARAYAINDTGTSYGQEKMFTASDDELPRVVTTAPHGETTSTAQSGGYVTNSGQSSVTARGVCWSGAPSPTLADSCTTDDSGLGHFHSAITGLSAGSNYYVRAYATNSAGTSYGEYYLFSTITPSHPKVHTLEVSDVTASSATVGGKVISQGGDAVTARGVCWSTSPHPTLSDNVVNAGSGSGKFQAAISGLTAEQVYYARAFATNQYGTSYGHVVRFKATFSSYPAR